MYSSSLPANAARSMPPRCHPVCTGAPVPHHFPVRALHPSPHTSPPLQPPRRVPQVQPRVEELSELYRELSQQPGLSTACLGPDLTTQYGGKYCSLYTGMGMGRTGGRGARAVPAYPVGMHLVSSPCSPQSGRSGTWQGLRTSSSAASTSSSTMEPPLSTRGPLAPALRSRTSKSHPAPHKGSLAVAASGGLMGTHPLTHRLLSRESPSGILKAVLRKVPGKEKEKEKQFLEVRRGLGENGYSLGLGAGTTLCLGTTLASLPPGLGSEPEGEEHRPDSAGQAWQCL